MWTNRFQSSFTTKSSKKFVNKITLSDGNITQVAKSLVYLDLALDGKTGALYGASTNNPEGGSFFKIDTVNHEVTRLNPPGTVSKYCIFGTITLSLPSLSLSLSLSLLSSPRSLLSLALSLSLPLALFLSLSSHSP